LGTPSCANSVTLMLVTIKNGIPSAKYSVGTQNQGDLLFDIRKIFEDLKISYLALLERSAKAVCKI